MPKPKTSAAAAAPKPKKPAVKTDRQVLYPTLTVNEQEVPVAVINAELAMQILGWETEAQYKERLKADPDVTKGAKGIVGYGDEYMLIDQEGNKIRCQHNVNNRPFDETHSLKLAYTILNRGWADSRNGEDMTVNGETIILTKTGIVDSGQHRLGAVILAKQIWEGKDHAHWVKLWPTEPTIEALIVAGVSENPKVTQTLDNVKPRSDADVVYTSPVFQSLNSAERKECSRMLAAATDFLWKRTNAKGQAFNEYKTQAALIDFRERHGKLVDCVKHLFEENKERAISNMKLSAGQCAAMMYLMAASATDIDAGYLEKRSQKAIKFDHWDKASEFWVLLSGKAAELEPVRDAIAGLKDVEEGLQGRQVEKVSIIAKAWKLFLAGEDVTEEGLSLANHYAVNASGETVFVDAPTFDGIDQGEANRNADPEEDPEETEKAKEEARKARLEEKKQAAKAGKADKEPATDAKQQSADIKSQLRSLKEDHAGKLLFFRSEELKGYSAWDGDADEIVKHAGGKAEKKHGMSRLYVSNDDFAGVCDKLWASGHRIAVVHSKEGAPDRVEELSRPAPKPAPAKLGVNPVPAKKDQPLTHDKFGQPLQTKVTPRPKPALKPGNAAK